MTVGASRPATMCSLGTGFVGLPAGRPGSSLGGGGRRAGGSRAHRPCSRRTGCGLDRVAFRAGGCILSAVPPGQRGGAARAARLAALSLVLDLDRDEDLGAAFPLLVYQATHVFPADPRAQFTYDVMDPLSMERAWRSAGEKARTFAGGGPPPSGGAGRNSTAAFYELEQAASILLRVQRQPRLLHALLMGDAAMVNQMAELAGIRPCIQALLERDQAKAIRELARFGSGLPKRSESGGAALRLRGVRGTGVILLVEASAGTERPGGETGRGGSAADVRQPGAGAGVGAGAIGRAWRTVYSAAQASETSGRFIYRSSS